MGNNSNIRYRGSSQRTLNTTEQPPATSNGSSTTRTYVDSQGFNVIEYHSPTADIIIRYNDTDMSYIYNSQIRYNGPIPPLPEYNFDYLFEDFDKQMESFDKQMEDFDERMKEFDRRVQAWNDETNARIASMNKDYNYTYSRRYTSRTNSQNPQYSQSTYQKIEKKGGCFSGCFGCLVSLIIFIVIAGLIFYGLAWVGESLIDLLSGLF